MIAEAKTLPADFRSLIRVKPKQGHKERELDFAGKSGNAFRLILRQNNINPLDFSIILAYCPPKRTQIFRLCRYNGKSHEHTNDIEGNTFYQFHIHRATERYQALGAREDTYAEPTDRFSDYNSALECLLEDCRFELPDKRQGRLF